MVEAFDLAAFDRHQYRFTTGGLDSTPRFGELDLLNPVRGDECDLLTTQFVSHDHCPSSVVRNRSRRSRCVVPPRVPTVARHGTATCKHPSDERGDVFEARLGLRARIFLVAAVTRRETALRSPGGARGATSTARNRTLPTRCEQRT